MLNSTIVTRENERASIEKLIAQKNLYSEAKNLFYIQSFISVIVIVLLSFLQLIFDKVDFTLIIASTSIFALFTDLFLENRISIIKERASKIQEWFDTYVLNIEWNYMLCGSKPEHTDIYSNSQSANSVEVISKLQDWYEKEIDTVSESCGVIICQKTNCNYDSSIRKKYNTTVIFIGVCVLLLVFVLSILSDVSLRGLLLTFVFPALPIIQWIVKVVRTNNNSIKNLENLNSILDSSWQKLLSGTTPEVTVVRQIQDGIYINRKESSLIPDYIYFKLRDSLEAQTNYSVRQLVKEVEKSQICTSNGDR